MLLAIQLCRLTSFLTPKLLVSMDAAERGSRRAADRGSDAAEIDRGSCKGSLVGGPDVVDFDPLDPCFPFLAEVVSMVCGERLEYLARDAASERAVTDRNYAHQRVVCRAVLAREGDALELYVILTHARPPGNMRNVVSLYLLSSTLEAPTSSDLQ